MEKSSTIKKLLAVVAAVLVLTVLCYEIYSLSTPSVKTQTAIAATHKETINSKMFAVRSESLISGSSTSGTLVSTVSDGERVAGSQTIAVRFSNDTAASKYVELEHLKSELARYENLNNQQNLLTLDVSKINADADELFYDMLETVRSGNLDMLDEKMEKFSDKLTTKQIFVDGNINFSEKISSLKKQIKSAESSLGSVDYIKAQDTGYYVSALDGYENMLDFSSVKNLSCAEIKKAISSQPSTVSSDNMGKLIRGYNWYFVGVISAAEATRIDNGDSVELLCDNVSRGYIPATVYHKGKNEDNDVAVVFVSNIMDEDISRLRIEDVQIVVGETDGLRISKEAVRVVDGVQGVYVLTGNIVSFKRIDVVYTGEDYVITKKIYTTVRDENDVPYVKLYDEVIVEGKELSDGKIIN
ncbi:MAG: hypothetical protein IJF40_04500 [Clostridia bacterium]|nr:hypothetical protein [Clostridia bacterium]MBQ7046771.1 hypothetical protein [Oscillospiraceae bacterium]